MLYMSGKQSHEDAGVRNLVALISVPHWVFVMQAALSSQSMLTWLSCRLPDSVNCMFLPRVQLPTASFSMKS